jgi:hypothetical protein
MPLEPLADPTPSRPNFGEGYSPDADKPVDAQPWSQIVDKLAASRNYWIVTTKADGAPHAAPVWGVWLDNRLLFGTSPDSVKGRNMLRDRRIVVHLESGDDVVVVTGLASTIGPDVWATDEVLDPYEAKYNFRPVKPDGTDSFGNDWFAVTPIHVLAWDEKSFVDSQVRYRFA